MSPEIRSWNNARNNARKNARACAALRATALLAGAAALLPAAATADQSPAAGSAVIGYRPVIGLKITPVPLNLRGKSRAMVGLGSYIVNAQGGCNDCHTHPSFAPGGDPYMGQPEQVNVEQYLAGGRQFGPSITAPNITPNAEGLPAGLTESQFIATMRTGHVPGDPPDVVLQVMPWPAYAKMRDSDLRAVYAYLTAIPSLPDNPNPGP